jgi:acyl-CoA reductase-like NAD-dependent aldehyde dehydrogenase
MESSNVESILKTSREAQAIWSEFSIEERCQKLFKSCDFLVKNLDHIIKIFVEETGKPRFEVLISEVGPIVHLFHYYFEQAPKFLSGEKIPLKWFKHRTSEIIYHPIGVIGIISPWNFPFSIPMGEIICALIAGNAVVFKPSEITPQISRLIMSCLEAADMPPGLVNLLEGDAVVGKSLVQSSVDKIVFTGSVSAGKWIAAECGKMLKPCSLELGGKDAMLVLEDADVEFAARGAVWGSLVNFGQVCASVERILVHEKIYDDFVKKTQEIVSELRQVPSRYDEDNTDLGRVIFPRQVETWRRQLDELKSAQEKILSGGELAVAGKAPTELKPTIVLCDGSEMVWREESFGPFIAIKKFSTTEEAVAIANDSPYGLTASVWSSNHQQAMAISKRINAHTVTINTCTYTHALAEVPWGGIKDSGLGGSVHGKEGLLSMVRQQHLHYDRLKMNLMPEPWWYPYNQLKTNTAIKGIKFMHQYGAARLKGIAGGLNNLLENLWR